MNHKRIYDQLVEKCRARGLNKKSLDFYTEKHHIQPKCLKGKDRISNLALLTPKEHLLAHLLLCHIYPKVSALKEALHLMMYARTKENSQFKYPVKLKGRIYEQQRNEWLATRVIPRGEKASGYGKKGPLNSNYGRRYKWSEETKKKFMETYKPYWKSKEEHPSYGKKRPDRSEVMSNPETRTMKSWSELGRTGSNSPFAKPIILTNPDGSEEYFGSTIEACKAYGLSNSKLGLVANGKRSHHKGFKARFCNKNKKAA